MSLTTGTKLGPYEILSPAGAGGMGEVYRARDTRLDRTVAIKVLPEQFSQNPDLKQRFEREARAISSLNHPNICHLYDVGHQDGFYYLVMEYIEGESLASRLMRGPLPLEQTLKTGIEIADALDKAHRQGIVHRDLKPGNVMLTKSGAKLLDFGLAKPTGAMEAASSFTGVAMTATSPVSPITQQGHIVGTFQYMSPEQVEGKEADGRSDIFALGAVLYEMATGKRAFEGKSAISIASAILEKDPEPISRTQPLAPSVLEHIVQKCLAKDPDQRWQSVADVASELRWASQSGSAATRPEPAGPDTRWRRRTTSATAIALALAAGIGVGMFTRPTQTFRTMRTVVLPPEKTTLALLGDFAGPPVISPDGAFIAFCAADAEGHPMLWLRPIGAAEARVIPGTQDAIFPFWSPNSQSIGFFADGKLKIVDINGGSPQSIADAPSGRGGSWGTGNVILFAPDTQNAIMRVTPNTGSPVAVTKIDSSKHTSHRWPYFLPDGKHFLFVAIHHDQSLSANDAVYYGSIDGGEQRMLFHSVSNAIYANGYVLYGRNAELVAQRFDPATGKISGEPHRVAEDVANDLSTWHVDASASETGTLVLANGGTADLQLLWFDRDGKPLGVAASGLSNLQDARLSPLADRIAMRIDVGVNDIWVLDLVRGVRTRLTFGGVFNGSPVWSPDGKSIIYASQRQDGGTDIIRCSADGSGTPQVLVNGAGGKWQWPFDWSRDLKYLLYTIVPRASGPMRQEIWALPFASGKPFLVLATGATPGRAFAVRMNSLSPNGRYLAYGSNEGGQGQDDIFIVPFGGGQGKWQISQGGGQFPQWGPDGKELFYLATNVLKAVRVTERNGTVSFGVPQTLFTNGNSQIPLFDVGPGAKKFLEPRIFQQASQPITVISNWTAELKK